jgi:hypothetical protein
MPSFESTSTNKKNVFEGADYGKMRGNRGLERHSVIRVSTGYHKSRSREVDHTYDIHVD